MARSARLLAVAASLAAAAPMTTLAFAPDAPLASNRRRRRAPTALSYRAGAETAAQEMKSAAKTETSRVAGAPHLDDTTHASLLNNPRHLPVLVDCYLSQCGPCKLTERSLDALLPRYSDRLLFCKWDADQREHSQRFVELLREHDATFRKLPTLVLVAGGGGGGGAAERDGDGGAAGAVFGGALAAQLGGRVRGRGELARGQVLV